LGLFAGCSNKSSKEDFRELLMQNILNGNPSMKNNEGFRAYSKCVSDKVVNFFTVKELNEMIYEDKNYILFDKKMKQYRVPCKNWAKKTYN
jgi:hypothetical protein